MMAEHENDNATLLGLTGELRNRIYRLVVIEDSHAHGTVTVRCSELNEPALLYANKQIRDGALSIFYAKNIFLLDHVDFNSYVQFKWQSKQSMLETQLKIRVRHHIKVTGQLSWPDLINWLGRVYLGVVAAPSARTFEERSALYRVTMAEMFESASRMRYLSWNKVVVRIALSRRILIALNPAWK